MKIPKKFIIFIHSEQLLSIFACKHYGDGHFLFILKISIAGKYWKKGTWIKESRKENTCSFVTNPRPLRAEPKPCHLCLPAHISQGRGGAETPVVPGFSPRHLQIPTVLQKCSAVTPGAILLTLLYACCCQWFSLSLLTALIFLYAPLGFFQEHWMNRQQLGRHQEIGPCNSAVTESRVLPVTWRPRSMRVGRATGSWAGISFDLLNTKYLKCSGVESCSFLVISC